MKIEAMIQDLIEMHDDHRDLILLSENILKSLYDHIKEVSK